MSKKSHPGDGTANCGVKGVRPDFHHLFNVQPQQKQTTIAESLQISLTRLFSKVEKGVSKKVVHT